MSWKKLAKLENCQEKTVIKKGKKEYLILKVKDEVIVVDSLCPHLGHPLSFGTIAKNRIICAWHNYEYDLHTGHCKNAEGELKRYKSKIENGWIWIQA